MYYTEVVSETEDELGNYKAALALHKDYTLYKILFLMREQEKNCCHVRA